jgi:hypothetical protein
MKKACFQRYYNAIGSLGTVDFNCSHRFELNRWLPFATSFRVWEHHILDVIQREFTAMAALIGISGES